MNPSPHCFYGRTFSASGQLGPHLHYYVAQLEQWASIKLLLRFSLIWIGGKDPLSDRHTYTEAMNELQMSARERERAMINWTLKGDYCNAVTATDHIYESAVRDLNSGMAALRLSDERIALWSLSKDGKVANRLPQRKCTISATAAEQRTDGTANGAERRTRQRQKHKQLTKRHSSERERISWQRIVWALCSTISG